jgi:hypothetical protein
MAGMRPSHANQRNTTKSMATALKKLTSLILLTLTAAVLGESAANAANTPPNIGTIPDQTVIEDQPTDAWQFVLSDAETSARNLQLSGATTNPDLVPPEMRPGGTRLHRSTGANVDFLN